MVKHWINQRRALSKSLYLSLIIALLIVLPLLVKSPYVMHIIIMAIIYSVLGMTFSMIYNVGRVTLGAGAFYAIGAYTSTLLGMKLSISYWLALPITIVVTGIIAVGLGLVIIKSSGMGFSIISLLFALVIVQITGQSQLLGGWGGFWSIPAPEGIRVPLIGKIEFVGKAPYYYLVLFLFLVIVLCLDALYKSRIGRAWAAIKMSDRLAQTLGINLYRYRLLAFVVASTIAGVVGSFFAHYNRVIEPMGFGGFFSIEIQLYSVLGGLDFYILGPIVGATIMTFLPEVLRTAKEFEPIITGVILIILILFFPGGILGVLKEFARFVGAGVFGSKPENFELGRGSEP